MVVIAYNADLSYTKKNPESSLMKKTSFRKFIPQYKDGKFIGLKADDEFLPLEDLQTRKVRLTKHNNLLGNFYIVGQGDHHYTFCGVLLEDAFSKSGASADIDKHTIDKNHQGVSEDGYEIVDLTNAMPAKPIN